MLLFKKKFDSHSETIFYKRSFGIIKFKGTNIYDLKLDLKTLYSNFNIKLKETYFLILSSQN